jgi:F0F1-type ATP synthase assembly protein I
LAEAGRFPVTDGTPAERANRLAAAMSLIGIGWFLAASIVGGIVGGLLLDSWLQTKPVFTLLGLLGGLAVAFYGTYQMIMRVMTKRQDGKTSE